jgi:hypothetical protein
MKPVVAKMPVPTMFEMTSAVALKKPSCRSNPGREVCDCVWGMRGLNAIVDERAGALPVTL